MDLKSCVRELRVFSHGVEGRASILCGARKRVAAVVNQLSPWLSCVRSWALFDNFGTRHTVHIPVCAEQVWGGALDHPSTAAGALAPPAPWPGFQPVWGSKVINVSGPQIKSVPNGPGLRLGPFGNGFRSAHISSPGASGWAAEVPKTPTHGLGGPPGGPASPGARAQKPTDPYF